MGVLFINNYIDFRKLFLEIFEEQEEILIEEQYQAEHFKKILDLINRAGGYTDEAYEQGAVFIRKSVAESQKEGFERSADTLEQAIIDIISMGVLKVENEASLTPFARIIIFE